MSRLPLIDPSTATGTAAELLTAVHQALGVTPNMVKAMAHSPATLKGYLELSGALSGGLLSPDIRERIALAVAELNECAYCLSAHTYVAGNVIGLSSEEIEAARRGVSVDPRTEAVLRLAVALVDGRGTLSDTELAAAREAGLTDGEITEVVGQVALNVLTNYFNKAVTVDIEWPLVTPYSRTA